jgi:membrane protease YdiL (CAAX protease family)
MWAVAPYLIPLIIVLFANWGVQRPAWKTATHLCLGLFGALMLALAFLLLASAVVVRRSGTALPSAMQGTNLASLGLLIGATALLNLLCLLPPVRNLLARGLRIDPSSPVHTVALTFAVYLGASSLSLLLTSQRLIALTLEASSLGMPAVVAGEVVFVVFALAGVGLFTRRGVRQSLDRLGLRAPMRRHWAAAVAATAALLALDYGVSLAWRSLWPASYETVSGMSQKLFGQFGSPWGAAVLGLSAGIGEEILFRGALQPRFRILLTAALFSIAHVQYTLSPALVEILIVGLVLGWIRVKSNTTTCIIIHAAYNFLNIVLAPFYP